MTTTDPTSHDHPFSLELLRIANGEVLPFLSKDSSALAERGWLTSAGHISTAGIGCLASQAKPVNLLTLLFAAGFRVTREGAADIRVGHENLGYAAGEWGTWHGMFRIVQWARGSVIGRGPWALYLRGDEVEKFQASVEKAAGHPSVVCSGADDIRGKMVHGERYLTTIKGVAIVRESAPATEPVPAPAPATDTSMGCAEQAIFRRRFDVENMTLEMLREEVEQHRSLLKDLRTVWGSLGGKETDSVVTRITRAVQRKDDLETDVHRTRMTLGCSAYETAPMGAVRVMKEMRVRRSEIVLANEIVARFNDRIAAGDKENATHLDVAQKILRAVANGEKPEVRIPWRRSIRDLVTDIREHLNEKELRQLRMDISEQVGAGTGWEALHASHDAEIREALRAEDGEATLAAAFRVAGQRSDSPLVRFASVVERALLAYLAASRESPHAVQKVALEGSITRGRIELNGVCVKSVRY